MKRAAAAACFAASSASGVAFADGSPYVGEHLLDSTLAKVVVGAVGLAGLILMAVLMSSFVARRRQRKARSAQPDLPPARIHRD